MHLMGSFFFWARPIYHKKNGYSIEDGSDILKNLLQSSRVIQNKIEESTITTTVRVYN
jgi:hypothetical protein